jgi:phosphate transport system substrate-binding protein
LNVPTGAARKGNAGVAAAVQQTQGAIGYVEYTYALKNYLTYASVANPFGRYVPASADSFQAAASAVDWRSNPDFNILMTNAPSPDAYPITASTFVLMSKTPANPARNGTALAFFKWVLEHGGPDAIELRYAPIPSDVAALIQKHWAAEIATPSAMVTRPRGLAARPQ